MPARASREQAFFVYGDGNRKFGGIAQGFGTNRQSATVLHACNVSSSSCPHALQGRSIPATSEGVGIFFACTQMSRRRTVAACMFQGTVYFATRHSDQENKQKELPTDAGNPDHASRRDSARRAPHRPPAHPELANRIQPYPSGGLSVRRGAGGTRGPMAEISRSQ
ncbi:hypothetical protein EMIT0111MI5_40194 [Burkholderia sp. IT-111MI5]